MASRHGPRKFPLLFFRTGTGREPVREWLKALVESERHAIGKDLLRAQWRGPVGMPLCRPLGGGLWEIRTDLPTKRTARVLICGYREYLVVVHQEDTSNTGRGSRDCAETAEGVGAVSKKNLGSSIDDFLETEGILEKAQIQAIKEVVVWQLAQAMKKRKLSKNAMAKLLRTSRSQVDRLLDPAHDITLSSLQRAAATVGHRVNIEFV